MKFNLLSIALILLWSTPVLGQEEKKARPTLEESTLAQVGDVPEDFEVMMTDSTVVRLSDYRGKVVLINFWATWCGPCMREFNEVPEHIIERYKDKDFVFLPISREEPMEVVRAKLESLKESGISFASGIDPERAIYLQFASDYIPRNFLIDKTGKIVYTSVGYTEAYFQALIQKIDELVLD